MWKICRREGEATSATERELFVTIFLSLSRTFEHNSPGNGPDKREAKVLLRVKVRLDKETRDAPPGGGEYSL